MDVILISINEVAFALIRKALLLLVQNLREQLFLIYRILFSVLRHPCSPNTHRAINLRPSLSGLDPALYELLICKVLFRKNSSSTKRGKNFLMPFSGVKK